MRLLRSRQQIAIAAFNVLYIAAFTVIAFRRSNFEFLLYSVVVIAAAAFILWLHRTYHFSRGELIGLTLWGLLHMAGGNVALSGGRVLYDLQLIPTYLRYDQFVHAFGFGAATLVCYRVLGRYLQPRARLPLAVLTLTVLMGCGLGAMNEIVEFVAVKTMPETNVGGYENTLWDLVFNFLGSVTAAAIIASRRADSIG